MYQERHEKKTNKHDKKKDDVLTAVWRNGGCSASFDCFVGKQTVVLPINIFGANNHLFANPKRRYRQSLTTMLTSIRRVIKLRTNNKNDTA